MNIIFPFVCGRCDNEGGAVFTYEFMHVCMNVCISLYTYVGVHACMCVRLVNDFINDFIMLRPRSVFVSVLVIRDLRTSCPRTDPSTSGATPKLVTGGWSGFFAKSKFTSGPTIRDSITMSWPSLMISLPSISPGPRRNVISPAIEFNVVLRQIGVGSSYSASSSIAVIDLSCRVADLFHNR